MGLAVSSGKDENGVEISKIDKSSQRVQRHFVGVHSVGDDVVTKLEKAKILSKIKNASRPLKVVFEKGNATLSIAPGFVKKQLNGNHNKTDNNIPKNDSKDEQPKKSTEVHPRIKYT